MNKKYNKFGDFGKKDLFKNNNKIDAVLDERLEKRSKKLHKKYQEIKQKIEFINKNKEKLSKTELQWTTSLVKVFSKLGKLSKKQENVINNIYKTLK